jgi:hypothetical protein
LDETKARSLIFPGSFPKTEREPEGGQRPPSHIGACLLEANYEVAWFEGPSAYPSAVVIAEALLVNYRTGEVDIPSLIQ